MAKTAKTTMPPDIATLTKAKAKVELMRSLIPLGLMHVQRCSTRRSNGGPALRDAETRPRTSSVWNRSATPVVQRKALTPNDFASLTRLKHRLLRFESHYAQAAKPFERKFTRRDLEKLMAKLHNGVELTRAALLRAMGLPQTTTFDVADTALTPQSAQLKDLDYYVELLFANRPEWRKLRLGIQAKEAELQMATSDYFPTFFLSVPVRYAYAPGRSRQTNPFAYDNFNFGAAGPVLGLHWSLGFGETAAKVAHSRAELMKLRAQEKTARCVRDGVRRDRQARHATRDDELGRVGSRAPHFEHE